MLPSGRAGTVEEAEEALIELAVSEFEDVVLNVAGETWFTQAASSRARIPGTYQPRLPVRFIDDNAEVKAFATSLAGEKAVGLDVETEMWTQRLCTVQVATSSEVVVIDALAVGLSPLAAALASQRPIKVIHNAPFERRILGEKGFTVAGVVDTLKRSRALRGPKVAGGHGLAAVCKRELGIVLDKSLQTSNWLKRPLERAQLEYAAVDAEVVLALDARMGQEQGRLGL